MLPRTRKADRSYEAAAVMSCAGGCFCHICASRLVAGIFDALLVLLPRAAVPLARLSCFERVQLVAPVRCDSSDRSRFTWPQRRHLNATCTPKCFCSAFHDPSFPAARGSSGASGSHNFLLCLRR